MFETLIREAADRFNLGNNAGPLVRAIVDAIFDSSQGGFGGLRQRFADAGLDDLFSSWIGTTPGDNVLQPDQFSAGFGQSTASSIASRLGIPAAAVNMAGALLLPKIVGLLTRGGAIPTARPADYDTWFRAAPAAATSYATPSTSTSAHATHASDRTSSGGGWWKWLIGLLLLAGAFFLFRSCQHKDAATPRIDAPVATAEPAAAAAPAAQTNALFDFGNTDGTVTVSGKVPSDADKTRLWDALTTTFGADKVNGDIAVDASTLPAGWMDKLVAALPELKDNGLQFGFDGDKLNIDTSGLPDDQRFAISEKLRKLFGGFEIGGLWDKASAALSGLKPNASVDDTLKALNLMNVYFDTGSANITKDSLDILGKAAAAIKALPADTRIEVGGHTDNTGDAAANMTLSDQRANAVVAKLGELGVAAGVLSGKGYGQDKPRADNGTEEGRAQNRRIEFSVGK